MIKCSFIALCLLPNFIACTSLMQAADGIIERSAEKRPGWVTDPVSSSKQSAKEVSLVFKKENVKKLDLGLKQAQAQAISEAKTLTFTRIEELFLHEAFISKKPLAKSSTLLLKRALNETKESLGTINALLQDVYYERLRQASPTGIEECYSIFVLLTVPRSEFSSALKSVAAHQAIQTDLSLQSIGVAVLKTYE